MPIQVRRKRQRSIRVLLTAIFIVPVVSLLGLWAFAASVTVSNAVQEHNFNREDQLYGGWAQTMFTVLATERLQAYDWLSAGGQLPRQPMVSAQQQTDDAVASFKKGISSAPLSVPSARPALISFYHELASLRQIRAEIDARHITPLTAFSDYNAIVDSEFDLYADLVQVNNTSLYLQAAASVEAGRAVELGSREVTLITGAIMSGGQMSRAARVEFAQIVATRRFLMADALSHMKASLGSGYREADNSAAYTSFYDIENAIVASVSSKAPIPVNALQFGAAVTPLFQVDYQAAQKQDRLAVSGLGTQIGNRLLLEVGLAGGAGLIAIVLSVFLMVRFGRRISRDLTGLQHAALELAEERLPSVVARLSKGEEVDVAAEAAPIAAGRIAETAKVADAFSSVQRTAVEAAVGQARLRAGVAQVFRNLAWRSQSLLHRQLTLLDGMERRSTEPETLDELFQLDHLTTRMRRHAEGLIILSGATPGRGWREPVPIMDVLRGAIAEVEDYKRVTVLCESADAVVGAAVADVIHLLAELIENATTYSPASTEVMIRAERVANGFVIEVEDRGIGITEDEMTAFNERLASPPEFDIADSNQLGLFVVGRLAAKHNIKITLRSSPYGGTSAIALLPHPIVAVSDVTTALPAGSRYAGFGFDRAGNGRQLSGFGNELPSPPRELAGRELVSGRELAGASYERAGAGFEFGGSGYELAGTASELAGTGGSPSGDMLTGTGGGLAGGVGALGNGGAELTAGPELTGPALTGNGPELAGPALSGPALTGPQRSFGSGWGRRQGIGSLPPEVDRDFAGASRQPVADQPLDVFTPIRPAVPPQNGITSPAESATTSRLTPYGAPQDQREASSPWSDSPVWKTSPAGPDAAKPWLPRRVRQASLAPQLRNNLSNSAEDAQVAAAAEASEQWPEEAHRTGGAEATGDGGAGPDPTDTMNLVQSLQLGLERARTSPTPAEEPWPSTAGNPELADWPEDPEGQ